MQRTVYVHTSRRPLCAIQPTLYSVVYSYLEVLTNEGTTLWFAMLLARITDPTRAYPEHSVHVLGRVHDSMEHTMIKQTP